MQQVPLGDQITGATSHAMHKPVTPMILRCLLWLLPLCFLAGAAWSDQAGLRPPGTAVELRAYGFGLFPLDGRFARFQGWLRYDPANSVACEVVLDIEAASLVMGNESIRDRIVGPDMMDVARFPNLTFHGTCHGDAVVGDLTMHGQTHPFTLEYTRSRGTITATGHLRRADWGITGSPVVGGSTIRISVSMPDPVSGSRT